MALTQKLEFRQSQALVMTPQLMQAIKLLQLSSQDLAAYVEAELERNPLLERAEPEPEGGNAVDLAAAARDGEVATGRLDEDLPDGSVSGDQVDATAERAFAADAELAPTDHAGPATYSEWAGVGNGARYDADFNLEAFVSVETTLHDHLARQLAMAITDPARRLIGRYLIYLVDEAGYLSGDLEAVAAQMGTTVAEVEAVLTILKGFDPPGICARDLAECLSLQLRERDRLDPAMQALVANLDLVAKRDMPALRKRCGVGDEDLADMLVEIRKLNPKPGLAFGSAVVHPIVPDVFVRPRPDGSWVVELNADTLPKVLVDQTYYAQVCRSARDAAAKAYLADCFQTGTWLVRALDQRARTILKVATEIVRQQDGFLLHGVSHLRPLNLKTIADAIGMHESTVSRVTANKYMATHRGIVELKYFFTSAIAAADGGEAHSAEAVRHRIRRLIDAERPDEILSDDVIVEELRRSGIEIARRTVAKYREAMRIPSSVQRRRNRHALGEFCR
jgi:RNA polymerase sigma-54 factor